MKIIVMEWERISNFLSLSIFAKMKKKNSFQPEYSSFMKAKWKIEQIQ